MFLTGLRPDLRIVSRVNEVSWLQRIQRAGADMVVALGKPEHLARLGQALLKGGPGAMCT